MIPYSQLLTAIDETFAFQCLLYIASVMSEEAFILHLLAGRKQSAHLFVLNKPIKVVVSETPLFYYTFLNKENVVLGASRIP